jgi:hypothetical protein
LGNFRFGDDGVAYNFGDFMSATLSDDDRRAVDLLLNREGTRSNGTGDDNGDGGGGGGQAVTANTDGQFHERISRAERLLSLLSQMPASDPPQDLVSKTLRRIEEMAPRAASSMPVGQTTATGTANRPVVH